MRNSYSVWNEERDYGDPSKNSKCTDTQVDRFRRIKYVDEESAALDFLMRFQVLITVNRQLYY